MSKRINTQEFSRAAVGVALCAFIGNLSGTGGVFLNSFSVFVIPLSQYFLASRASVSLLATIIIWGSALSNVVVGRLIDRMSLRPIMIVNVTLYGFFAMSIALAHTISQLFVLCSVLACFTPGINGLASAIAGWFRQSRATVMSLITIGGAAGAATVPYIAHKLTLQGSWRLGFFGIGAYILIVTLPVYLLCLKTPLDVQSSQPELDGFKEGPELAEVLRSPIYWILIGALCLEAFCTAGFQSHALPMLTERGISANQSVGVLAFLGFGTVVGQVATGVLMDRYSTPRIAFGAAIVSAVGLVILAHATAFSSLCTSAFILGGGAFGEEGLTAYMITRYFGLRCFATVFGISTMIVVGVTGAAPVFSGFVRDHTGTYDLAFGVFSALAVLAAGLLWTLKKFSAQLVVAKSKTEIRMAPIA